MRRRFYELAQAGSAPIATEALARIAVIYRIESDISGQPAEERRAVRQQHTRPLIEAFEPWLRAKLTLISQKTKLAEAIRYALSRWDGLSLFIDDGRVEIDNNAVERAIRPLAMHRSLCAPSLSPCEHWKRVFVGRATRATFSGKRYLHSVGRQIRRADLEGRSRYNLRGEKDIRPDQPTDRYDSSRQEP